ncbi:hypothetical protein REPUB_Repub19eG0127700 [Reevesia pubescens]
MALVDKFGRIAFFLEAGTEMFIYMVAVAITLALKFGEGQELPLVIGWFLVIIICLFVLAYGSFDSTVFLGLTLSSQIWIFLAIRWLDIHNE